MIDFVCKDHDFIIISAAECEALKSAAVDLDCDGRMTNLFLEKLLDRYSRVPAMESRSPMDRSPAFSLSVPSERVETTTRRLRRSSSIWPLTNEHSKLSSDYDFFVMLHNGGRRAARNFLDAHFDDIGVKSTVDLSAETRAEWA